MTPTPLLSVPGPLVLAVAVLSEGAVMLPFDVGVRWLAQQRPSGSAMAAFAIGLSVALLVPRGALALPHSNAASAAPTTTVADRSELTLNRRGPAWCEARNVTANNLAPGLRAQTARQARTQALPNRSHAGHRFQMLGDADRSDASPLFDTDEIDTADEAVARLRAFHHTRDQTGALLVAGELLNRFPDSDQLLAWHALILAQAGREDSAAAVADRMARDSESDLWRNFGIAAGLQETDDRGEEALKAARRAAELAPDNPEVAWLEAEVLWETEYREEASRHAYRAAQRIGTSALLFAEAGYTYFNRARMEEDVESLWQRAEESLRTARTLDSTSVQAFVRSGDYYDTTSKPEKAYRAYKQAARHSTSPDVHSSYWHAVRQLPGRPEAENNREIRRDVEALMERRPEDPNLLYEVALERRTLGDDQHYAELKNRLLRQYPRTSEAEWVQIQELRSFRRTHRDSLYESPSLEAEYRQKLWDFIEWPHHPNQSLLSETYRNLYYAIRDDSTASADTLVTVVENMGEHNVLNPHIAFAEAPKLLAERGLALDLAADLARKGITAGTTQVRDRRSMYDTEREFQRRLAGSEARYRDALGWVYFHDGQLDQAERQLQKAYSLTEPYDAHSREKLYHLGRLYEEKDSLERAQEYYAAGLVQEGSGENPNEKALKRIYRTRHGDLVGYDGYLSDLREEHRAKSRKEVLATRKENPEPIPSFTMKTLSGDSLSSQQLPGQVTVINFWGKWCGPCVAEMPDLQKLYEKYRDTPDVRVLTIDYRDQVDELRTWMKEREFTFPTLIDRGYVQKAGIRAYPTTWFLNEDGEIVFVKEGMSHTLVREFSWRIDALRGS